MSAFGFVHNCDSQSISDDCCQHTKVAVDDVYVEGAVFTGSQILVKAAVRCRLCGVFGELVGTSTMRNLGQ